MAVITSLVKLFRGQTESSDNPNPRTASQVLAASLTFSLTAPIFDSAGARPAQPFIVTFINRSDKKPLSIYVTDPSTELSADGLTITLASATQKNIDVSNTNSATSDFLSGTTPDFDLDQNSAFRISISALDIKMLEDVLTGNIGTGNTNIKLGDGTTGATQGFEIDQGITSSTTKYGADASGNPLITLPGGSSFIPGAAAGSISGGDGIDFTASVVSVDTADTNTFVSTSSGAGDSDKVAVLDASGFFDTSFLNIASQVEAEAGTDNEKVITSLRTKQAIDEFVQYGSAASGAESAENSTGYITTSTTDDLTIALGGTGYNRFKIDIIIGAADGSATGVGGNTRRWIVEGNTGGDYLAFRGDHNTSVQIATDTPTIPYNDAPDLYANQSITIFETGGATTTITINSMVITGSDLVINYTTSIGSSSSSAVARVRAYIVYK